MGRWWSHNLILSLASNLVDWCLVGQLGNELVSLNVDVLFAWWRLRRLDITSEELLGCFCPLLLQAFWVVFALVGLEQLVRVGAGWNNHGSIGASSEDSLVIGDILREVLLLLTLTVRIFIFGFVRHNARMCCKARGSISLRLLLGKHF